ncbi:MAG TPA: porin [Gemmatimonadota bacterium]|nr:porin [Gemmatimonadota bacterium]
MRSRFGLMLILLLFSVAGARAQEERPPVTTTLADRLWLEGLLHLQTSSSSVDSSLGVDGELRRIRIALIGTVTETVSAAIQADFDSDRARVRDAYVEWKATPALALRAGQFKVPVNGIELESAKRLLVIERESRIRGVSGSRTSTSGFLRSIGTSGRNRGLMLSAGLGERVTLQGGAWLGSGESGDDNDGKEYAARLTIDMIEAEGRRPLVAAVAAVTNGFFGGPGDTLATVADTTIVVRDTRYAKAFEGWLEYGRYRAAGPHAAVSVIGGDNPALPRLDGEGIGFPGFLGVQAWGEYVISTGREFLSEIGAVVRVDRFDPDTDTEDDASLLLTPGVNLYFGEKVKLQINHDRLLPEADAAESESAFRAQLQLLL